MTDQASISITSEPTWPASDTPKVGDGGVSIARNKSVSISEQLKHLDDLEMNVATADTNGDDNKGRAIDDGDYDTTIDMLIEAERVRRLSRKRSTVVAVESNPFPQSQPADRRKKSGAITDETSGENLTFERSLNTYEQDMDNLAQQIGDKRDSDKVKKGWWASLFERLSKVAKDDSMPEDDDGDDDDDDISPSGASKPRGLFSRLYRAYIRIPVAVDLLLTMSVICLIWFTVGIALGVWPNQSGPTQELSDWQKKFLRHFHVVPTIMGIIGSLIIVFCYFWFRSLRNFHLRLILYLSIADLGLDGSFLLHYVWNDFCFVQAACSEYFPLSSAWVRSS